MAPSERIAVVGAGIIGCAVAFELARRGGAVTVFDGRSLGAGSTQASAGILAPYTEAHQGGRLFELTVRGLAVYDEFVERVRTISPLPFEYRRCGTLEVAEDDVRARELRERLSAPWAAAAGLQWLDGEALRRAAPFVDPGSVGALQCAVHGYVAVPDFVQALADAVARLGARIHLESPVTRVELASDRVLLHTSQQTHGFDRLILCAGTWSAELDPLGAVHDRIRPVRGQLVRLESPVLELAPVLWSRSCYIVPWQSGMVLVGATSEEVGFDERATLDGVRGLLTAGALLVPALGSARFVDVRVGLRPATEDGLPILGPAEDPRIIYAAGHFRNGILLAPLTAQLIADHVFDNRRDPAFSAS